MVGLRKFIGLVLLLSCFKLYAQTADKDIGCAPMEVQFSSPNGLSEYFWIFDDGTTSEFQNPSHIYTDADRFDVRLFEGEGGRLVGQLTIQVLEAVEVDFSADALSGCTPLMVQFTNESKLPDDLPGTIQYEWVFGDGTSSGEEHPQHIYEDEGTFTVSLKIITEEATCDDIEIKPIFITSQDPFPIPYFKPKTVTVCDSPAVFEFDLLGSIEPGARYTWDFGDGNVITSDPPVMHTYSDVGGYMATLTVSTSSGCETVYEYPTQLNVLDHPPLVTRLFPDTICFRDTTILDIDCAATQYIWIFPADSVVVDPRVQDPKVFYKKGGANYIRLLAGPPGCRTDTTFLLHISEPNAHFTVSPELVCHDQFDITFSADDSSHILYTWFDSNTTTIPGYQAASQLTTFSEDSFLRHVPSYLAGYKLEVTNYLGCRNSTVNIDQLIYRPEALFLPQRIDGCAPLSITFQNISLSPHPVNYNYWDFGDGSILEVDSASSPSHTFMDPGTYFVRLIIENDSMCRDTSYAVRIEVGEPLNIGFSASATVVCPGDTVSFFPDSLDERVDGWHYTTENGRAGGCSNDPFFQYKYNSKTGTNPTFLTVDYNGCFSTSDTQSILVHGPISVLGWRIPCHNPYQVTLYNRSVDYTDARWIIGPDTLQAPDSMVYTFAQRGTYDIRLEATNSNTGCPLSIDSATIYITDVEANFEIEPFYCAGDSIQLSAANSIDVDTSCYKGYTWWLPNQGRPRTVWVDTIPYTATGTGPQEMILVVEDINGCTDTMINPVTFFQVNANFLPEDSSTCLTTPMSFLDQSSSDTTLTTWSWSFGSMEQNPMDVLLDDQLVIGSRLPVTLTATDAAGCTGVVTKWLDLYEIETEISYEFDTTICEGDAVRFKATDFREQGSYLLFDWNSTNGAQSQDSIFNVVYDNRGEYLVTLEIEEERSGCTRDYDYNISVQAYPETEFQIPKELKCEDNLVFINQTTWQDSVLYTWIAGDGSSPMTGPIDFEQGYGAGTYDVQLIATTSNGCADTTLHTINIIAPEGNFLMSDSALCRGDHLQVELLDTSNVMDFSWDFGDGVTISTENPAIHTYDQTGTNRDTRVVLTLMAESGCQTTIVQPLRIDGVLAGFEAELDSAICGASFFDISENPDNLPVRYLWYFGDGTTSNEQDPEYVYGAPGTYLVAQIVESERTAAGCIDTAMLEIIFPEPQTDVQMPNVFTPNGDGTNDYFNFVIPGGSFNTEQIEVTTFKIFNRWGQLVYDNYNPSDGWNGEVKGKKAPAEVYAYVIELVFKGGAVVRKKGNVTLMNTR